MLWARVHASLLDIGQLVPGGDVVAVTHGGVIYATEGQLGGGGGRLANLAARWVEVDGHDHRPRRPTPPRRPRRNRGDRARPRLSLPSEPWWRQQGEHEGNAPRAPRPGPRSDLLGRGPDVRPEALHHDSEVRRASESRSVTNLWFVTENHSASIRPELGRRRGVLAVLGEDGPPAIRGRQLAEQRADSPDDAIENDE